MPDMPIKVRYSTIDGYGESRSFQSIQGARAYARKKIGDIYDISETFGYAVDMHGIGKLTVKSGAKITDLFPGSEPAPPPPPEARPGYCPRHPGVQIAFGAFDGLCNRCEGEMDDAAMREEATSEAAIAGLGDQEGAEAFGAPPDPDAGTDDIPF